MVAIILIGASTDTSPVATRFRRSLSVAMPYEDSDPSLASKTTAECRASAISFAASRMVSVRSAPEHWPHHLRDGPQGRIVGHGQQP